MENLREPTEVCDFPTSPQAALLYRHQPISHGLNTFGLACRAVLKRFAPRRPGAIASMAARFAAPAFPGDTIRIEMFKAAARLQFRARGD